MWEISENLHRADLTALERSEHVAEWIRLSHSADELSQPATVFGGRGKKSGIRAAARSLGIDKDEAQRSIKVDSLPADVKQAARDAGLADNRAALLRAAAEPNPAAQLARIHDERSKIETHKANRQTDRVIALTEAEHFAEWITRHANTADIPSIIAWIEGTKPRDVISALRRSIA